MIEREKKRIRLEKKYALKRTNLLADYKQEENFAKKLEQFLLHKKVLNTNFHVSKSDSFLTF